MSHFSLLIIVATSKHVCVSFVHSSCVDFPQILIILYGKTTCSMQRNYALVTGMCILKTLKRKLINALFTAVDRHTQKIYVCLSVAVHMSLEISIFADFPICLVFLKKLSYGLRSKS